MAYEMEISNDLLDRNTFAKKYCYNTNSYQPDYWRDALRYGKYLANYILTKNEEKNLSNNEIHDFLKDLHENECLGIYSYFFQGKLCNDENNIWDKILKLNPFGEDLIFNSYITWFLKKDYLLSEHIKEYPIQMNKFVEFLKRFDPDTEFEHLTRVGILRDLLNDKQD